MNKPLDQKAKTLIVMMNHHLSHSYNSVKNKQRNLDTLVKEFLHLDSLPVASFSAAVWDDLNHLFESYRPIDQDNELIMATAAFKKVTKPKGRPYCRVCRSTDVSLFTNKSTQHRWDHEQTQWVEGAILDLPETQACNQCKALNLPIQTNFYA